MEYEISCRRTTEHMINKDTVAYVDLDRKYLGSMHPLLHLGGL